MRRAFPGSRTTRRIRPEYFDAADRRIFYLVEQGFVPCVVGAWGYHLPWLGADKMKQHWRYLVARWGALPVVWCAAGEGTMPYYLSKNPAAESALQKREWTEVIRSIHATDPFHRLVTIHPPSRAATRSPTPGSWISTCTRAAMATPLPGTAPWLWGLTAANRSCPSSAGKLVMKRWRLAASWMLPMRARLFGRT